MAVEVVYETHSTSVDNERGIATGWLDGELSEWGREQASELGRRRRDDGIATVYASDPAVRSRPPGSRSAEPGSRCTMTLVCASATTAS